MNSQTGATPGSDIQGKQSSHSATAGRFVERRAKPRIREPIRARVRGLDAGGHEFDLPLFAENISSVGLFLRIPLDVKVGAELNLLVLLPNGNQGITVALEATVVRVEPAWDHWSGIGLAILRHEFI